MPDIYFTDSGGQRRAVSESTPLPTGSGSGGGGGAMATMSLSSGTFAASDARPLVQLGPLLPAGARVKDVVARFNELLLALESAGYGTVTREE